MRSWLWARAARFAYYVAIIGLADRGIPVMDSREPPAVLHQAGLDGVSAAPWLIPVSILSAAQANPQNPRPAGHASPATAGVRWEAFAAVTGK